MAKPARRGKTWVVCPHGHGSNGDQLFLRADVREQWLMYWESLGLGVLTPNIRNNAWMCPEAVADLHELIAWTRKTYNVERFIMMSGSMGGTGALIYSAIHPEDLVATIALCPATDLTEYHAWLASQSGGDNGIKATRKEIMLAIEASYKGKPAERKETYDRHSACVNVKKLTMPLLLCHGDADPLIPVEESRRLVKLLGWHKEMQYLELPGGGHDTPLWIQEAKDWVKRFAV